MGPRAPTRAQLRPIIKKIGRRRPLLSTFCQLWLDCFTISQKLPTAQKNLSEFERVLFNDVRDQGEPFLTPDEARIVRFFDRGVSAGPKIGELKLMTYQKPAEYKEPEGDEIGDMWQGPHWSPNRDRQTLIDESQDERSFNSASLRGILLKVTAYGRPAFVIKPPGGDVGFLVPDHIALTKRLETLDPEVEVWIKFEGEEKAQNGKTFFAYRVKKVR
jgi:hypothetical protein